MFVNDGEFVFSSRVYPTSARTHQLHGDLTATLHRF
ncbi:GH32 C-terminal domain-containing protein [Exiguobacterium sp. SL-10]|nr:GH32 C-terminal domain-containing protein [Exiguobacterium sp. SL-10]